MIFAFDLDETIVKGDIISEASEIVMNEGIALDKLYTEEDCIDFEMSNFPAPLREQIFNMFSDPLHAVWNKKFIEGVWYFLHSLSDMGHEVNIITSRPLPTHNATKAFVEQKLPFVNGLWLANDDPMVHQGGGSKKYILEDMCPDVYFDDAPKYIDEAVELGIETYMVQNKRTSWNHSHETTAKKIKNPAYFPVERVIKW